MRRLVLALLVPVACALGAANAQAAPPPPQETVIWPTPGTP